jgi:hypothetical protein
MTSEQVEQMIQDQLSKLSVSLTNTEFSGGILLSLRLDGKEISRDVVYMNNGSGWEAHAL